MTILSGRHRYQATRTALGLGFQAALLVAVPTTLWHLSGNPLPTSLPSWAQIRADYDGLLQQPDQVASPLMRIAADALWIAWAWYTLWSATAVVWVLFHLPHAQLPRFLALITPALTMRALGFGILTAIPTLAPATAFASPAQPTASAHTLTATPTTATATVAAVHEVRTGENLWDIARTAYNDPTRWPVIYQANKGIIQPDGNSLQNPDLIIPGWRLTIPALITAPAVPEAVPPRTSPPPAVRTAPRPTPARPDRPRTTGYALPDDAGYIGFTLIAAIGAAVAILRTRNRRQGHPTNQNIPHLAQHLAAVHTAARSAAAYQYRPDEHPGQQPPPLTTSPAGHPVLGTSPDGQDEITLDAEKLPGPLVLTGPGARAAARALAISTLATEEHTLRTNRKLANDLIGETASSDESVWLDNNPPTGLTPNSTTIRTPDSGTRHLPGSVLLGEPTDTDSATILHVEQDGTHNDSAEGYQGTRLHTLSRDAAARLYETLSAARPEPPANWPSQGPMATFALSHGHPEPAEASSHDDTSDAIRSLTTTPLILRVLGQPDILSPNGALTSIGTEQAAAILTLLALHPDGIRARTLRALEWPNASDNRRARLTLATAINRARTVLRTALDQEPDAGEYILYDKTRQTYQLNPEIISTDLSLARRLTTQAGEPRRHHDQLQLLTSAAALYRGELASHLDDNRRDWLTTARYAVLSEATGLNLHIASLAASTSPATAAAHALNAVKAAPEDAVVVIRALQLAALLSDPELGLIVFNQHQEALRRLGEEPTEEMTHMFQNFREPPDRASLPEK